MSLAIGYKTPSLNELECLLDRVLTRSGVSAKQDIAQISRCLPALPKGWHANGDDTAAIPLGEHAEHGYQLFAIEGMQSEFVKAHPWFAGWCSVMVNCSDIAAMGGTPTAVVDALWCHQDDDHILKELVKGMTDASECLGVPIVGGHTNLQSSEANLAVSILGHATTLLSSYAATPGQQLIAAIDHRGAFMNQSLNWNAATSSPMGRMREDLTLLPAIAENGWATACKDISQAGLLGTCAMMLENSECGAEIRLEDIQVPESVEMEDWLCAFPSFGYLLTADRGQSASIIDLFQSRDIHANVIGDITSSRTLNVSHERHTAQFYSFENSSMTGFSKPTRVEKTCWGL